MKTFMIKRKATLVLLFIFFYNISLNAQSWTSSGERQITVNQMPSSFFANWYSTDGNNVWTYGITKNYFRANDIFYKYDGIYKSNDNVYTIKISSGSDYRTYYVKDIGSDYIKIGGSNGQFTLYKSNTNLSNSEHSNGHQPSSDERQITVYGGGGVTDTFTDPRDGQTYQTVKIGSQTWMAENLNYETSNSWWYDNSSANGDTYGRLYTWDAALNACPSGWHLPSDDEWTILSDFLGGTNIAGGKMKEAGTAHWNSPNTVPTNSSGFTALPGGYHNSGVSFIDLGYGGYWWSSTEYSGTYAWLRDLYYNSGRVYRHNGPKVHGFSVRCLKSNGNTPPTAIFTVSPSSGTTSTNFAFDASSSTDNETPTSQLQVRWDFDGNGSWDTGWDYDKTTNHQYSNEGTYTAKLEVKDPEGLTGQYTKSITVSNGGGGTGILWFDNFDSYQLNTLPSNWVASGNGDNSYVTNDNYYSIPYSFSIQGISGGDWEGLNYREYDNSYQHYQFEFEYLFTGEGQVGSHNILGSFGIKSDPSWESGYGRIFIRFNTNHDITCYPSGTVIGSFNTNEWIKCKVDYKVLGSTVELKYYINGQLVHQENDNTINEESQLKYVQLISGDTKCLFDDIKVKFIE